MYEKHNIEDGPKISPSKDRCLGRSWECSLSETCASHRKTGEAWIWDFLWRDIHEMITKTANGTCRWSLASTSFFDFLSRNQTFSLPECYPGLNGVCSDRTVSSEFGPWRINWQRLVGIQPLDLWKSTLPPADVPNSLASLSYIFGTSLGYLLARSVLLPEILLTRMSDFLLLPSEMY